MKCAIVWISIFLVLIAETSGAQSNTEASDMQPPFLQEAVDAAREKALLVNASKQDVTATFFAELLEPIDGGLGFVRSWRDTAPYHLLNSLEFAENYASFLQEYRPLVIGGLEDVHNQFPSAVVTFGASDAICSGVVVAPNRVLTAAHCVCKGYTSRVRVGKSVDSYEQSIAVTEKRLLVSTCDDDRRGKDVAILELGTAANIVPAAISNYANFDISTHAVVVGFGNAEPGRPDGIRRFGRVVIASHDCNGSMVVDGIPVDVQEYFNCVSNRDIVAGSPFWPTDSCSGDSGGPLFVEQNGKFELVAITSRGIPLNGKEDCGAGGVYTRLDGDIRK